jgi:hypothetical protein
MAFGLSRVEERFGWHYSFHFQGEWNWRWFVFPQVTCHRQTDRQTDRHRLVVAYVTDSQSTSHNYPALRYCNVIAWNEMLDCASDRRYTGNKWAIIIVIITIIILIENNNVQRLSLKLICTSHSRSSHSSSSTECMAHLEYDTRKSDRPERHLLTLFQYSDGGTEKNEGKVRIFQRT